MEKQIGFKSRVLQETVNENMINILFVKDDSPVAYLYGYGSNNGYYSSNIDLIVTNDKDFTKTYDISECQNYEPY